MKKIYIAPDVKPTNLLGEELMLQASTATQAATDAEALSRQGSGSEGSGFWTETE